MTSAERLEIENWQPIVSAPRDGTFVRLQRVTGLCEFDPDPPVGSYRRDPNGFEGWFDREGYLLSWPSHWLPEHGRLH